VPSDESAVLRAGTLGIIPAWHNDVKQPVVGRATDQGGTPKGDALSSLDANPKVLEFLQNSLQSAASSK
jgi:hypothetical protein